MGRPKNVTSRRSAPGYTDEDLQAVEFPDMSDAELAALRPAQEVLPPAFFEAVDDLRRLRGRPTLAQPKKQVTLRLDADVLDEFKQQGKGWQSRINSALRKAAGL